MWGNILSHISMHHTKGDGNGGRGDAGGGGSGENVGSGDGSYGGSP
jgi:hypothetical protein